MSASSCSVLTDVDWEQIPRGSFEGGAAGEPGLVADTGNGGGENGGAAGAGGAPEGDGYAGYWDFCGPLSAQAGRHTSEAAAGAAGEQHQ